MSYHFISMGVVPEKSSVFNQYGHGPRKEFCLQSVWALSQKGVLSPISMGIVPERSSVSISIDISRNGWVFLMFHPIYMGALSNISGHFPCFYGSIAWHPQVLLPICLGRCPNLYGFCPIRMGALSSIPRHCPPFVWGHCP